MTITGIFVLFCSEGNYSFSCHNIQKLLHEVADSKFNTIYTNISYKQTYPLAKQSNIFIQLVRMSG